MFFSEGFFTHISVGRKSKDAMGDSANHGKAFKEGFDGCRFQKRKSSIWFPKFWLEKCSTLVGRFQSQASSCAPCQSSTAQRDDFTDTHFSWHINMDGAAWKVSSFTQVLLCISLRRVKINAVTCEEEVPWMIESIPKILFLAERKHRPACDQHSTSIPLPSFSATC